MASAGDARVKFPFETPSIAMFLLRNRVFRHYVIGLICTFAGAWLTGVTGSMLPLALGAAAAILQTPPLVRAIWSKKIKRNQSN